MNKIFNNILIVLFIIFIGLYISNKSGFYEYERYKKVELTNKEIAKFEDDVKNNRDIDVSNYLENTKIDYSNGISRASLSFSNIMGEYIKKCINGTLKIIVKLMS